MEEFTTISIYSRASYPSKETIKLNSSGGYRAQKGDYNIFKFVGVTFKKETIITGVETQGYGNADVQEWIKTYFVTFNRQKSTDEEFLLDKHGKPKVKHLRRNNTDRFSMFSVVWMSYGIMIRVTRFAKDATTFHKKNNTQSGDKHCGAMHIK